MNASASPNTPVPSVAPAQDAQGKSTNPIDLAKAREAAQEFEAVFLAQLVTHMFAGVGTDSIFGGGPGEDIFRSVMFREYGKVLAQSGGIGVADSVMREILRFQEEGKEGQE